MDAGAVRMLHFPASAPGESDILTLPRLRFEYPSVPLTSRAARSLFCVALSAFVAQSLGSVERRQLSPLSRHAGLLS